MIFPVDDTHDELRREDWGTGRLSVGVEKLWPIDESPPVQFKDVVPDCRSDMSYDCVPGKT